MAAVTLESVRAAVVVGAAKPALLDAVRCAVVVYNAPLVRGIVTYDGGPARRSISLLSSDGSEFKSWGVSSSITGRYALPAYGGQPGDRLVAVAFDEGTGGVVDPVLPHKTQRLVLE